MSSHVRELPRVRACACASLSSQRPLGRGGTPVLVLGLEETDGAEVTQERPRPVLPRGGCWEPQAVAFLASPLPPAVPAPSAAPLAGVTRHCEPGELRPLNLRRCPGLGAPGPLPCPAPRAVLFAFEAGGVAAALSDPRENGRSEAGRERPGFPARAERRGLQTRRGQVHHARVWTVFKDCPSIQFYE